MAQQSTDDEGLRAVLDAMPSFVFCVDADVRLLYFNRAAASLVSAEGDTVLLRRGGEALHCLHHQDSPHGCGYAPRCDECPVRGAVTEAIATGAPARRRGRLDLVRNSQVTRLMVLVMAAPCVWQGQQAATLVVDDISLLTELQRLVTVCTRCRRVRDDDDRWIPFDACFAQHLAMDFSHGYCPECGSAELAALDHELAQIEPAGGPTPDRADVVSSEPSEDCP